MERKNLSREKYLEDNKIAKEEMKKLRKEGRLKPLEERGKQNQKEFDTIDLSFKSPGIF